jgi:2'-5' RNA ligase
LDFNKKAVGKKLKRKNILLKRIFVAIEISEEARRKVSVYQETLRREFRNLRVGWEKQEKLHLTVKFLGDVDDRQLGKLIQAVEKTAEKNSSFKLQIFDSGVFPNKKRARVLCLGITDETGSLQKISEILEDKCEKFGFTKEKRKFNPHLTIARIREPGKSKELVDKHLQNKFEPVEFEVSRIVIIESKLHSTGSVYSIVSEFKLKN